MKTSLLKLAPVLAIVAMMFASCGAECCDCSTSNNGLGEICKDDYNDPTGLIPWSTYRTSLSNAGCDC